MSLVALAAVSCKGERRPPAAWADTADEAVAGPSARNDSLRIDIFVDGTVSMAGFVADGTSRYVGFLDGVESALQNGLPKTSVHYFKFGRGVRELDRPAFRAARGAAFYAERGISETTQIDSVIQCNGGPHVTVVLTDLFQDEGDVQSIVSRIKTRCFAKGLAVGILGVPSQFRGMIYDARVPPYPYATTADTSTYRPFYALMLGAPADLERIYQALRSEPGARSGRFTLISPFVVQDFDVRLTKDRASRDVNRRADAGPRHFRFDVRKGGQGGTLIADVTLRMKPVVPDVRAEGLVLTALRRQSAGDSIPSRDFSLAGVKRTGDRLTATLNLRAPGEPGTYAYRLALVTDPLDGFVVPAWVERFSSSNPTASNDPNRTLNLDRFVLDLRRAASSVRPPEVARWYVDIHRN